MSDTTASKPVTPRRSSTIQALSAFFRTPTLLRTPTTSRSKRIRPRTSSSPSQSPRTPALPAVLLQTYSISTDSIVLTSLPSAPFCCHEDLLTMSRSQLESVVHALNERLPRRMRIAPEDDFWWNNDADADDDPISRMSEAEMRRRVEELVGIRTVKKNRVSKAGLDLRSDPAVTVPPAPKAIRTRGASWKPYEVTAWEMEVDDDEDDEDERQSLNGIDEALMGSSPLAFRSRTRSHHRGRSDAFPRLAILQEVNEGGESNDDEPRPSKKQRTSVEITDCRGQAHDVTRKDQGSRLIENIDVSTSSLFTEEEEALSLTRFAQHEQTSLRVSDQTNDDDEKPKARVQAPVLRRRSARIALKQATSADTEKMTDMNVDVSRLSSPPTRSPLSSADNSTQGQQKSPSRPREFTIRLPFTSTPPHLKTTRWVSSAPRILRSHSQRLSDALKPSKSGKENTTLGRSRSERLPRALDMTFVTVDRPRYRFSRRKSKGAKTTTMTQEDATLEAKQVITVSRSKSNGGYDYENENENENENGPLTSDTEKKNPVATTPGGVFKFAFPPVLGNSLALSPRSRAPSTSTVGSTCGSSDSPAQSMRRGGIGLQTKITPAMNDGADDVRAALGKMVVD